MARGCWTTGRTLRATLAKNRYAASPSSPQDEALLDLPENRGWVKPPLDDPRLTRCEKKHYEERIGRLTARNIGTSGRAGLSGQHAGRGGRGHSRTPASR